MDEASYHHFELLEQRLVPNAGDGGTPLVSIERGFTERSNSRSNSRDATAQFQAPQANQISPQDVSNPPPTPSLPDQTSPLKLQTIPIAMKPIVDPGSFSEFGANHVDKRQKTSIESVEMPVPSAQRLHQERSSFGNQSGTSPVRYTADAQQVQQQCESLVANNMSPPPARTSLTEATGQKTITKFFQRSSSSSGAFSGGNGNIGNGGGRRLSTDSNSQGLVTSSQQQFSMLQPGESKEFRGCNSGGSSGSTTNNSSSNSSGVDLSSPPSLLRTPSQQQQLEDRLQQYETQLQQQKEANRREQEAHSSYIQDMSARYESSEAASRAHIEHSRDVIKNLMTKKAEAEAMALRKRLALDTHRLGREVMRRSHVHRDYQVDKYWEDGQELIEVKEKLRAARGLLEKVKEENKKRLKEVRKAAKKSQDAKNGAGTASSTSSSSNSSSSSSNGGGNCSNGVFDGMANGALVSDGSSDTLISSGNLYRGDNKNNGGVGGTVAQRQGIEGWMEDALQAFEVEESGKAREEALKHDVQRLVMERKKLELETVRHRRELKLVRQEGESDRRRGEVMISENGDYLLMFLLGKGGFSEVWQAYDLRSLKTVAVKILRVDPNWSEEKRNNYAHHATREYKIHCIQKHPYVVRLLDVFEIDAFAFATVLECCEGGDLDMRLKKEPGHCIPEQAARPILLQVLAGLRYLNTPDEERLKKGVKSVIHYDLKPGNILFDSKGNAKITDFGLSKIVSDTDSEDIELTSQGTGTYW